MDPLDDVFAAMRVESALYARLEVTAPWGISFTGGTSSRFGLVVHGACWLSVDEQVPVHLSRGDCYVLSRGLPYVLRDDPRSPTRSCTEVVRDHVGGTVALGGGGERATIITGWFTFDERGARPLLDLMPSVLLARIEQGRTDLIESTLRLLNEETERPGLGSHLVVSRLADIILVQAIRAQAAEQTGTGWLAALSDQRIGRALQAMHADFARDWTVAELADLAGMSRSGFAALFNERVGEPPLSYLTRWRMFRAGHLLRQSTTSIGEIADTIGYRSEAAFNKAFKRSVGMGPGAYRRAERAVPSASQQVAADGMP